MNKLVIDVLIKLKIAINFDYIDTCVDHFGKQPDERTTVLVPDLDFKPGGTRTMG